MSTDAVYSLRRDLQTGRSIQFPRSQATRIDAAAGACPPISPGAMARMLMEYALRDYEAGFVEVRVPPGEIVRTKKKGRQP